MVEIVLQKRQDAAKRAYSDYHYRNEPTVRLPITEDDWWTTLSGM